MEASFTGFMDELYQFGKDNDARYSETDKRMRNVVPETGEFLHLLIRAVGARRVLELGTSNGYSTLWLAHAVDALDGRVTTLEKDSYKIGLARENFQKAGPIGERIDVQEADFTQFLPAQPPSSYDFIFMDSNRALYVQVWEAIKNALRPGGLIAVDNATSHPAEQEAFFALVKAEPGYLTSLVTIGKGVMLIWKPSD